MWIYRFAFIFVIFQLTFSQKCNVVFKNSGRIDKCCKLPKLIDEKTFAPLSEQYKGKDKELPVNVQFDKMAEFLNLGNFDKTVYKNFLKKSLNDSEWQAVFLKNSDSCMDLVPKILTPFVKKMNWTEEGIGAKFLIASNCWITSGFADCPTKYYTDSADCKELKSTIKECLQNSDEMIKALTAPSK